MLMGAHAWMLVEARKWTNRHTEVRARIFAEARARMPKEARAQTFILILQAFIMRIRDCTEENARIFLLNVWA